MNAQSKRCMQTVMLGLMVVGLGGCFQARAARDLRGEYASEAYLQSVEAAAATRSLAKELLTKDSPETVKSRLEGELVGALEAARLDDNGAPLADPQLLQERTIRAVLWYEGERRGLQDWYATEMHKIESLGKVIEGTGEAALRSHRMANDELKVSEDALRSFAKTRLPEIAGETLKAYLETRNAGDVAATPPTDGAPSTE